MKNILTVSALALTLSLSANAFAQNNMGGGYTGPSVAAVSVAEALKLSDDAPVVMVGKIEKGLGGEKYLFNDGTATVTIEIDDDDWRGLQVGENDTVEIRGEVDKDFMNFEIDVDSITKK